MQGLALNKDQVRSAYFAVKKVWLFRVLIYRLDHFDENHRLIKKIVILLLTYGMFSYQVPSVEPIGGGTCIAEYHY